MSKPKQTYKDHQQSLRKTKKIESSISFILSLNLKRIDTRKFVALVAQESLKVG